MTQYDLACIERNDCLEPFQLLAFPHLIFCPFVYVCKLTKTGFMAEKNYALS